MRMMKKNDAGGVLGQCRYQCKEWVSGHKKQFLILLSIYLLAFCSIFRADFAYWDDIGRTYAGYHGWLDWSRYGTEILATFVHAGWRLTDISPLPQMIACVIIALGGILILDIFGKDNKIGFWSVTATALAALAPYFLGMISYKFDSPYMALSFLASIIPFIFRENSRKIYVPVSVICLLIMCTTYQASSGIYPMIVAFLVMRDISMGKNVKRTFNFLGVSVLCYIISLVIFWLLLMRENGVAVFSFSEFIPSVMNRYITYYKTIYHDYTKIWLILTIAIVIIFLYVVCRTSVINKLLALFMGIFTVFAGSFLCFGACLFISRDAYDTRTMYGFNVFLTLMAVFISFHAGHWIFKMVYTALAWSFFVFSLTYGNALASQQNYRDYRVELLVNDLNDLEVMNTDGVKEIQIEGDIGYSPVIRNMAEDYPILDRAAYIGDGDGLIPTGLGEGIWGGYYFFNYLNIPDIEWNTSVIECRNLTVLKDTMYHTIKGSGNSVLIELK